MSVREVGSVGDKLDAWYQAFLEQEGVELVPRKMSTRKRAASGAVPAAKKARRDAGLAKLAQAIVRADAGMVRTGGYYGRFSGPGAELKFFDTTLAFTYDSTGEVPATGQLNLIPQGVTESTRVGRKCTLKSIDIRAEFSFNAGAATSASTCAYLMLVLDKQCNGAAAAITDVLSSNDMRGAQLNLANSGRFVILRSWAVPMTAQAGVSGAYNTVVKPFRYQRRLNLPIEFSSTTGAITEIRSNNLFLLAGSSTSSDDLISFNGVCRVRFSDM